MKATPMPNTRVRTLLFVALGLLSLGGLSACGAIQGAKNLAKAAIFPTVENLKISTHSEALINADDRGAALPVTVRIYQLSEMNQLLQSDYTALLERDQDSLGTSLIQRYEYLAFPASNSVQEFPIKPGTRYIAVLAVMRKAPAPAYYLLDAARIDMGGLQLRIGTQNMQLVGGAEPLNKGNEAAATAAAPSANPAPPPDLPNPKTAKQPEKLGA
ncbi:type VI secretion system lipoprotein TssJ [Roseateles koreensis]|uniref:Type VI secretion system lipoprotein TssJ n=1 Tax=Roseateles koreensis TaxID=2987526 RepID=A0ABT5KWA2_9BURK|nr:type VI secretion system lipoprotein TssJ [Roseateles koreensis]MDC8786096.1 type VI secretion system lipoprotein TssJ [Roseateles koreensis]